MSVRHYVLTERGSHRLETSSSSDNDPNFPPEPLRGTTGIDFPYFYEMGKAVRFSNLRRIGTLRQMSVCLESVVSENLPEWNLFMTEKGGNLGGTAVYSSHMFCAYGIFFARAMRRKCLHTLKN